MKTQTLVSSGGVVFRPKRKTIEIAIARLKGDTFVLPKGLVEQGENLEEAAKREVKEETNLEGDIVNKLSVIDYWFYWEGKRIHKFVHFYLIKHKKGKPIARVGELEEVMFLPIKEALKRLRYKSEKEVVAKALTILEEKK